MLAIVKMSDFDSERIVELHAEDFKRMGIAEGRVLRLKGRRAVYALAHLADEGALKPGEAGVGGQMQARLGAMTGSEIEISRDPVGTAQRVQFLASTEGMPGEDVSYVFKPDRRSRDLSDNVRLALAALAHAPVRKGDGLKITPIDISDMGGVSSTPLLAPEMQRLVMDKTVYIKIVDTAPAGPVVCGPDTEWCEADLKQFLHGNKDITFDMVGGLKPVKDQLRQAIEGPIKNAGQYAKWKIRPTKGILLFGPPGCGKTMLAKAVAKELEAELIYVRGAEIYNPYFGASEQIVKGIFSEARTYPRAVIFWDEFDAVGTARGTAGSNSRLFDTILNQILVEMDGMGNNDNVIVIAATNRLDQLDPALTRPGRFDFTVRVPLPNENDRKDILGIYLKDKPFAEAIDVALLAARTIGYTGADLENLVRVASLDAMDEADSKGLGMGHVLAALEKCRPSLTKEQVDYYEAMINSKGNPSAGKRQPMYG